MSSLIIILCIAGAAIAIFLFWRRSRPKVAIPADPYNVRGMWYLGSTGTRVYKASPLGIGIWYKSEGSAHRHGDIAAAADRAFMRLMNDIPREYTQFRQPSDYMLLVCDETYPSSAGDPSLKVVPVPNNLKGTIYDKGGFLLAAGVTVGVLGDRRIQPPACIIPNISSVDHIDYLETAIKHEFEHRVAEQDHEFHVWKVRTEQHPFYLNGERQW